MESARRSWTPPSRAYLHLGHLRYVELRVISWNVARRSSRLAEQAMVLAERQPDVIALQEITRRTESDWGTSRHTSTHGGGRVAGASVAGDHGSCGRWLTTSRTRRNPLRPRPERRQRLGKGPHAGSDSRGPDCRPACGPRSLRRPEHAAPRVANRRGDLIRTGLQGKAAPGTWRRVGRSGARGSTGFARDRLRRRLPCASWLRATGAELDVAAIEGHGGGWRHQPPLGRESAADPRPSPSPPRRAAQRTMWRSRCDPAARSRFSSSGTSCYSRSPAASRASTMVR